MSSPLQPLRRLDRRHVRRMGAPLRRLADNNLDEAAKKALRAAAGDRIKL